MKARVFSLLSVMSLAIAANAQLRGMTDLEAAELRGKVKEVKEYRVKEQRELRSTTTFNTSGYIVDEKSPSEWGENTHYEYKAPGEYVKQTFYTNEGKYRGDYTFEYDEKGQLKYCVKILDGDTIFTENYTHDPAKRTTTIEHISKKLPPYKQVVERYPNGRIKRMIRVDKGDIVSQDMRLDMKSKPTEVTTTDYGGNVHKTVVSRLKTIQKSTTYVYGEDGKKTVEKRREATLNGHGDITVLKEFNAEGKMVLKEENKYTYDSHGNWTRRVKTHSRWGTDTTEREISYYK